MAQLANYLCEEGVEVTLVTQADDSEAADRYATDPRIRRRISDLLPEEVRGSRFQNLLARIRKLRGIWEEERPDVILSFIGKNNVMALWTAKRSGIPVVCAVRADPAMEYEEAWTRRAAFFLFPKAARVLLQTKQAAAYFPAAVQARCAVLPNPLDPAFAAAAYEGPRDGRIVVVGRIDENKRQKLLLETFARLAARFPTHRVELFGTGPQQEAWQAYAQSLPCADRIRFAGSVKDVATAIRTASCFVLLSDQEGMPNALLEAMALGLPVIATDCPVGVPRELIVDGENGRLIPCGDGQALEEALIQLLTEEEAAARMGKAAQAVGERFAAEKVLPRWKQVLEEAADTTR